MNWNTTITTYRLKSWKEEKKKKEEEKQKTQNRKWMDKIEED